VRVTCKLPFFRFEHVLVNAGSHPDTAGAASSASIKQWYEQHCYPFPARAR